MRLALKLIATWHAVLTVNPPSCPLSKLFYYTTALRCLASDAFAIVPHVFFARCTIYMEAVPDDQVAAYAVLAIVPGPIIVGIDGVTP
jgi:hypothetical protein